MFATEKTNRTVENQMQSILDIIRMIRLLRG